MPLFSPQRLLTQFYELTSLPQRLRQMEVHTKQLHSLLQLNGLALAVPPVHLQVRVSGAYYNDFFLHGQFLLDQLDAGLTVVNETRSCIDFDNVLDFGCGCGRTLIPLTLRSRRPAGVHGVDIDPEAVDWLAGHYPQLGSVRVNPTWPTMPHADAQFDLLYAISVFTHLPEAMEQAWLADISRVLKPGGYALLTVHGEAFFDAIARQAAHQVRQNGFVYVAGDTLTDGLPEFYRNSYHTASYIRAQWRQYFDVLRIIPKGLDQQDLVVLRKR